MGILAILTSMGVSLLYRMSSMGSKVSGNDLTAFQLRRARRFLETDLLQTSYTLTNTTLVPGHLPSVPDSQAIWCLSAINPATTKSIDGGGIPFWQRNVLYYAITPGDDVCGGGASPAGLDDYCPHKILLRKVVDQPPVTTPTQNPEAFLADMSAYLTRPLNSRASNMAGEPALESFTVVAQDLLTFDANRSTDVPCEIRITLQATNLTGARKRLALGSTSLSESVHTLTMTLSIFAKN